MAIPDAPVEVTFDGYNRVMNRLRKLAAAHPGKTDPIIGAHAKRERQALAKTPYPPKLPNQKYKRTGRLARSWSAVRNAPASWSVINRASHRNRYYAIFVVGKFQARIHVGRWWIAKDEAAKRSPELVAALTELLIREYRNG